MTAEALVKRGRFLKTNSCLNTSHQLVMESLAFVLTAYAFYDSMGLLTVLVNKELN